MHGSSIVSDRNFDATYRSGPVDMPICLLVHFLQVIGTKWKLLQAASDLERTATEVLNFTLTDGVGKLTAHTCQCSHAEPPVRSADGPGPQDGGRLFPMYCPVQAPI